ncbi:MAG: GGDEF domain-containing protein [Candidatus Omnitrophica bacterium]|nr:GGDEF domain-containing protein [Candidatus Omnitrophota bacterium]
MTKKIARAIGVFVLLSPPSVVLSFLAYTVFHQIILFASVLIAGGVAFYLSHVITEKNRLNHEMFLKSYELKKAKETLESCLPTDTQTQVYNERLLESRLTEECDRAARYQRPLSCLLVAVDGLPELSRQYGSVLIQVIIQEVADFLKENTRSVDIIVRQGEESFIAILPETQRNQARIVAERIRSAIGKNTFRIEGRSIEVTVSMSIVSFDSTIHQGKDDVLNALKKILTDARKIGPNQIAVPAGD